MSVKKLDDLTTTEKEEVLQLMQNKLNEVQPQPEGKNEEEE